MTKNRPNQLLSQLDIWSNKKQSFFQLIVLRVNYFTDYFSVLKIVIKIKFNLPLAQFKKKTNYAAP